jgi:hypothetical protein
MIISMGIPKSGSLNGNPERVFVTLTEFTELPEFFDQKPGKGKSISL